MYIKYDRTTCAEKIKDFIYRNLEGFKEEKPKYYVLRLPSVSIIIDDNSIFRGPSKPKGILQYTEDEKTKEVYIYMDFLDVLMQIQQLESNKFVAEKLGLL